MKMFDLAGAGINGTELLCAADAPLTTFLLQKAVFLQLGKCRQLADGWIASCSLYHLNIVAPEVSVYL